MNRDVRQQLLRVLCELGEYSPDVRFGQLLANLSTMGIASAAMSRLESGQNTNPTYATLAACSKAIGAELSLQVRVPNGSPEEERNAWHLTAQSVASLHAALTMVLRQLESLKAHV